MELAGLEPAASWVRFGRLSAPKQPHFAGISGPWAGRGEILIADFRREFTGFRPQECVCGLNLRPNILRPWALRAHSEGAQSAPITRTEQP